MLAELRRAGLKLTPQRIAIVRELADDLSHPTAQGLFERLQPAFPTMSFATVYNTLDALARCGLTGTLVLPSGSRAEARTGSGTEARTASRAVRFDPNTEPHHHAVCDACGTVVDIPTDSAEAALPEPERVCGFRVLREERTYRGLCSRCSTTRS